MKKQYNTLEKGIITDLMDLSLRHGPVEIQLTAETEDTGDFAPAIIVRTAPDGVLRGLAADDRIADMAMEFGELHITPAGEGLAECFEDYTYDQPFPDLSPNPGAVPIAQELRKLNLSFYPRFPIKNKDLNGMTWEEIAAIGAAGTAPRDLGLGSTKDFALKNGQTMRARIIGFNHDQLADDPGLAPITWELTNTLADERPMNSENTNATSWEGADLRAWLNGEMWELLPDDLKAVIKPVVKQTSAGGKSTEIKETRDLLFIKSERELTGRCFYSAPGEGHQYALFAAEGISWAMKDPSGGAAWPWLRSPYASNATNFCSVHIDGTPNINIASISYGVAFGFCV